MSHHVATLDMLGQGDSPMHRLDPRAKIIALIVFIASVASFPKYSVGRLTPYFFYPMLLISAGGIPLRPILGRIIPALPFAIMVGLFNPLLDATPYQVGPFVARAGWVSFASILARFLLTVGAVLCTIAVTGFPSMCRGLSELGVPRPLVMQIQLTHRYLFTLLSEGERLRRARNMRSFGRSGLDWRTAGRMFSVLFMRTLDRGERIHAAMLCRGYNGSLPALTRGRFNRSDALFLLAICVTSVLFRLVPVTDMVGGFLN
ncbi:MAG TPA: cobalt ECF transporter T component CbiQ [Candidatus Brocadiia bacterium]|nr:cobalt ECF transporter T component CbiQ [Candidatus Brocadiia bacterium]